MKYRRMGATQPSASSLPASATITLRLVLRGRSSQRKAVRKEPTGRFLADPTPANVKLSPQLQLEMIPFHTQAQKYNCCVPGGNDILLFISEYN